ncbi:huntingtin-like [Pollicipes pollicipes]|uniref:huntingtin-like n=1 Tax=Pollicipes pollicipes TaxID=41117 RepID=UPI001885178C|nr:huntingtin-like [Pollicipes pollicipes]
MLSALLRVLVTHVREEVLLARVDDLGLATTELYGNRQRTVNAQEIVVRFLLSSVELLVGQLASVVASPVMSGTTTLLPQLIAQLLQITIYIVQSGSFGECARCAMWLVSEGLFDLTPANQAFLTLATVHPVLLLCWCNLLTLLNYSQLDFWRALAQPPRDPSRDSGGCLALDLVRKGSLILLCDYMCENTSDGELLAWLLTSHITELVALSAEPPVFDMLDALHRNPSASGLLIQAIAARCRHLDQPLMAQRVLRCLEGAPAGQYGPLLLLLSRRLMMSHHLAVADEVVRLACRKLEIVLAAEDRMISEEDFNELVDNISKEPTLMCQSKLVSLLTRLGRTFGVAVELRADGGPRPVAGPPAVAGRAWFLDLVRDTCGWSAAPGRECARLLARLDRDEVEAVLLAPGTDLAVLSHCFTPGLGKAEGGSDSGAGGSEPTQVACPP